MTKYLFYGFYNFMFIMQVKVKPYNWFLLAEVLLKFMNTIILAVKLDNLLLNVWTR